MVNALADLAASLDDLSRAWAEGTMQYEPDHVRYEIAKMMIDLVCVLDARLLQG
ncbi:MAG: hypothetical protein DHS20C16_02930 [Phycisphaerae bacterium]|nr:MAG: hypothetical protein DHS20C16_02930 [Phycisphaerae bacterium]